MGSGCSCSRKAAEGIKDGRPTATATILSKAMFPSEGRSVEDQVMLLKTFKDQHQVQMHKKISELCVTVQTELPAGVNTLRLNTMKMKDKDWQHFTYCLGFCPQLTRLHLWKVTITRASLDLLASYILGMPKLQYLTLGDMDLNSFPLGCLAEALKNLYALKELVLTVNYMDSAHFAMLVPGIEVLDQLEVLSLDENELGDAGAQIVVQLLVKLLRLRSLSLKFNSIRHKGFAQLLSAQRQYRSVKLHMEGNDLTDDEFEELELAQT